MKPAMTRTQASRHVERAVAEGFNWARIIWAGVALLGAVNLGIWLRGRHDVTASETYRIDGAPVAPQSQTEWWLKI